MPINQINEHVADVAVRALIVGFNYFNYAKFPADFDQKRLMTLQNIPWISKTHSGTPTSSNLKSNKSA